MSDDLKEKVKTLTQRPGVYRMLNKQGHVIYVGKASNLKKRVSSYFRTNLDSVKTQALMQQVVDFEVTVTGSEVEALLLESNLIKKHRPRYNVLLRDDKSYPYLYLSTEHKFPRLDFYRGAKKLAGRYFGPFPNAGSVRENLAFIQKIFKLRQCSDTFFRNRSRPCLQYQIDRCTAPCVGYVSQQDYADQVKLAVMFLEGKSDRIISDLTEQMEQASVDMQYERAAQLRDQIITLRKLQTKQYITGDKGDIDVIAVAHAQGKVVVAILFVRAGRLIGNRNFYPNVPKEIDAETVLAEFLPQYYLSPLRGEAVVEKVIVAEKLSDRALIQSALQQQLATKIQITDRKMEKYRRWQSIAKSNAEFALGQHLAMKKGYLEKLQAMQNALQLPNPISRVECFDISHTMGEETVASCVVFTEEGPVNKEYRRFNIKGVTAGDDYAALYQALLRRYKRLKEEGKQLPDVIMIDGGKGQLQQGIKVLEELQISGVQLLAVAKGPSRKPGMEQLWLPRHQTSLQLAGDDMVLHLIQFIRDEAHRFAITAYRNKRGKKRRRSRLETIEGVGPSRRRELLRHFGGLQELMKASVADIAKVPGISEMLAKRIYDGLHE